MSNNPSRTRQQHPFRDAWEEHMTPPPSPRHRILNNESYAYSPYGYWPNEQMNGDQYRSSRRVITGYENAHNRPTLNEEHQWTAQNSPQRNKSPSSSPDFIYDPFEPLPISLLAHEDRMGSDDDMNNEIDLNRKREREIERDGNDFRTDFRKMSNLLRDELNPQGLDHDSVRNQKEKISAPPKNRKKRRKGMPKRPLSAYNLFFQSERVKIIAEPSASSTSFPVEGKNDDQTKSSNTPTTNCTDAESANEEKNDTKRATSKARRTPHGKISFEELGRLIGSRWKELPEKEKKTYKDKAVEESNRYAREMEEFHNKTFEREKKDADHKAKRNNNQMKSDDNSRSIKEQEFASSTRDTPKSGTIEKEILSDTNESSPEIIWNLASASFSNDPISITVNDVDGIPQDFYLAYAAVRMTKQCAQRYMSCMSCLATAGVFVDTSISNNKAESDLNTNISGKRKLSNEDSNEDRDLKKK